MYVRPPPEAGLPPGTLIRADKGVYGFTDGARRWFQKIVSVFEMIGATLSMIEPAFFYVKDAAGKWVAMFLIHVDDILFAYEPGPFMDSVLSKLKQAIKFGDEKDAKDGFVFCGRQYKKLADDSVQIGMNVYADNLKSAPMTRERKQQEESDLDSPEFSSLGSVGGQVQWLGRQGHPRVAFRASRLASSYSAPKVKRLKEANAIVRLAKKVKDDTLIFRPELDVDNAVVLGVQGASFHHIENSRSQAGKVLLLADPRILDGGNDFYPASSMEWRTNTIKRVVRATLTAEGNSAGESAETVEYMRYFLAECFCPGWSLDRRDELAEKRRGAIVTDAKSLFDTLRKDGSAVKDRRLRLEMNILKNIPNLEFRWVRSEMLIADELTKGVSGEIHQYAQTVRSSGVWTLGVDPRAPEAKRGRALVNPDQRMAEDPENEPEPGKKRLVFEPTTFDAGEQRRLPLDTSSKQTKANFRRVVVPMKADESNPAREDQPARPASKNFIRVRNTVFGPADGSVSWSKKVSGGVVNSLSGSTPARHARSYLRAG